MKQFSDRLTSDGERGVSLANAITQALKREGVQVLTRPRNLSAYVLDLADYELVEVKVFLRQCDPNLLLSLEGYAKGREDALTTSKRIQMLLIDSYMIQPDAAERTANDLVKGVARYIGDQNAVESLSSSPSKQTSVVHPTGTPRANGTNVAENEVPQPAVGWPEDPEGVEPIGVATERLGKIGATQASGLGRWANSRKLLLLVLPIAFLFIAVLGFVFMPYPITFDGNQATAGEQPNIWTMRFANLTFPYCGYQRDGYKFVGWSEDANGQATHFSGEDFRPSGSTTYYAIWRRILTASFRGYADEDGMEDMVADGSGTLTLPQCSYTREGYRFVGWSAEGRDEVAKAGSEVELKEPTTFAAVWSPLATFAGSGADEGEVGPVAADKDGSLTLPECAYKRKGYRFAGWSVEGRSEVAKAGSKVELKEPMAFAAKWSPLATFLGSGAEEGKMEPMAAKEDGTLTLPECAYKRADCVFRGWLDLGKSKWGRNNYGFPIEDASNAGEAISLEKPMTYNAVWEFGDSVKEQVSVEPITSGDSNEGYSSGILLRVTNNSPYTIDLGCKVRTMNRLYCIAPGQSTLALNAVFGSEDWSQYSPILSAYAPLDGWSSLEGEYRVTEKTVEQGKLEIEVTNTGKKRLHIREARVLGRMGESYNTQGSGDLSNYDKVLGPNESLVTRFGVFSNDDTQWDQYERSYYLYGYAEDAA